MSRKNKNNRDRKDARKRLLGERRLMEKGESCYTHMDREGMLWRFENGRPVSMLADEVMEEVLGKEKKGVKMKEKVFSILIAVSVLLNIYLIYDNLKKRFYDVGVRTTQTNLFKGMWNSAQKAGYVTFEYQGNSIKLIPEYKIPQLIEEQVKEDPNKIKETK